MTTENSRADALTDDFVKRAFYAADCKTWYEAYPSAAMDVARAILAASTVEQPAAAPIDPRANRGNSVGDWLWCELMDYCKERGMPPASNGRLFSLVDRARAAWDSSPATSAIPKLKPPKYHVDAEGELVRGAAPSPADERAVHALDCQYILDDNPWAICTCGKGSPNNPRAASANETGAEAVAVPAGWKLVPIEPTVSMLVDGFESWPDPIFSTPEEWGEFEKMTGCQQATHKARLCYSAMLAAAPQPAQADARVGLTEQQIESAVAQLNGLLDACESGSTPDRKEARSAIHAFYRRSLLAAHPGQPEPRAEVTDDDKLCAERYRWLRARGGAMWQVYVANENPKKADGKRAIGSDYDAAVDAARTGASS